MGLPRYKLVETATWGTVNVCMGLTSCSPAGTVPIQQGRLKATKTKETSPYSSILSGKPQQRRGLLSPCPVWMKLFLSGLLISWADRPATDVTTFRGNWPTLRVRLFWPRHQ